MVANVRLAAHPVHSNAIVARTNGPADMRRLLANSGVARVDGGAAASNAPIGLLRPYVTVTALRKLNRRVGESSDSAVSGVNEPHRLLAVREVDVQRARQRRGVEVLERCEKLDRRCGLVHQVL